MDIPPRVRLKDVAAKAGVSVNTVSLAMRNSPRISEPVRERIQELARTLGYRPDPVLSNYATYLRKSAHLEGREIVALLRIPRTSELKRSPTAQFEHDPLLGARHQAQELGYEIELVNIDAAPATHRQASRVLWNRGIRGILIESYPLTPDQLQIDWSHFAAVSLMGEQPLEPFLHNVASNLFHSMFTVMQRVRNLGYRCPALLLAPSIAATSGRHWIAAFEQCARNFPEPPEHPIWICEKMGIPGFLRDRIERERVDVLIYGGAGWIARRLSEDGLVPGGELGLVCMDLVGANAEVSGIFQDRSRIARVGLDILNGLLQRNHFGPVAPAFTVQVEGQWVEGNTLAKRTR